MKRGVRAVELALSPEGQRLKDKFDGSQDSTSTRHVAGGMAGSRGREQGQGGHPALEPRPPPCIPGCSEGGASSVFVIRAGFATDQKMFD